jgi:hypothetical protein
MASARTIHGFMCCEGRFLTRITGIRRLVCVLGGGMRPPARPGRGRGDQAVTVSSHGTRHDATNIDPLHVHRRHGYPDPVASRRWSSYRCLYHHRELPVNRCCRLPGWSSRTAEPLGDLVLRSHHAHAPSGQRSHPIRLWVVRTDGRRDTGPVSAARRPADTPSAVGGRTTVVDPCDRRRASARRGGPSFTPSPAPGRVPGRLARRAAPCLRCGLCVRGARPGDGRCRGAGQRSLGSRPAIAVLRRGG